MPRNASDSRAPAAGRAAIDRSLEVLIVDDKPDVRELLVEFFKDLGFRVAAASDGRAAITALEREPERYWLVVTDVIMPGANGLAVLSAAKTLNPALQVVIITGYAALDTAVEAVRLGAFDYISKPFTLGEIEVMIHRLGQRLQLEAQGRQVSEPGQLTTSNDQVIDQLIEIGARLDRLENLLRGLTTESMHNR